MVRLVNMSDEMREVIWDRFAAGELPYTISRDLGRFPFAVHQMLGLTGGVRPPRPTRSPRALSVDEREEISRGLVAGESLRSIAGRLGRAPSTISREIARNGGSSRTPCASTSRNRAADPDAPCKGRLTKATG